MVVRVLVIASALTLSLMVDVRADTVSNLRTSLAACGDFDHDGVTDFVVTSRDMPHGSALWILSGKDGSVLRFTRFKNEHAIEYVSAPGDFDGDGLLEIFVSWVPSRGRHEVHREAGDPPDAQCYVWGELSECCLVSSRTLEPLFAWSGRGSVRQVRDRNGDGVPDFVFTSQARSPRGAATVRICSGRDGSTILSLPAPSNGRFLLEAAAVLGDLDGDGIEDLALPFAGRVAPDTTSAVVSATRNLPLVDSGSDYLPTGVIACSGKDGHELWRYVRILENEVPAVIVASLGDIDGDGVTDVLVAQQSRWVRAVSGKRGTMLYEVATKNGGVVDAFASSLDVVADLDHDGISDWVVGANEQCGKEFFDEGYVWVRSGKKGTLLREAFCSRLAGVDVCALGDVDGDGVSDIALHSQNAEQFNTMTCNPIVGVISNKDGHTIWEKDTQTLRKASEEVAPKSEPEKPH